MSAGGSERLGRGRARTRKRRDWLTWLVFFDVVEIQVFCLLRGVERRVSGGNHSRSRVIVDIEKPHATSNLQQHCPNLWTRRCQFHSLHETGLPGVFTSPSAGGL